MKEWLVRTRSGEILGPFTARELMDELQRQTFSLQDEIAPSRGLWVSAQSLANHDVEEVTHTSTRNQSYTPTPTPTTRSLNVAGTAADADELTPTPSFERPTPRIVPDPAPLAQTRSFVKSKWLPVLTAAILLVIAILILLPSQSQKMADTPSQSGANPNALEGDSPFVREIYQMIRTGETATALKRLTEHHENHKGDHDFEYLIPYAALLILEGDSAARAKKYLEQVLSSSASPTMKSRAHHWLGYLALALDEGDMGEGHFLEALQLNPKDAAARFNLGRAYLKQEKFSQALDYLQLAELEVPDLWLIHIYKGQAKTALGNMEEARAAFRTAVQNSPDRWISYVYYALFLMGVRETDGARETLRKMLARDPSYETLSPPPFGYFQEKTNYGEYLNAFQQIMEKAPAEERELGRIYLTQLQGTASAADHKRLETLATKGGLAAKLILLRTQLENEAKPDELKATLGKIPTNISEFGSFGYVLRGEAKARMGQNSEAIGEFQKALLIEPSHAAAHFAYAKVLRKMERGDESQQHLRTLLTYHPNYIPAILPTQY